MLKSALNSKEGFLREAEVENRLAGAEWNYPIL